MKNLVRAFLGIGSNLGDSQEILVTAIDKIDEVTAVSGLYETAPIGGPEQDSYLNLVVEINTAFSPRELLGFCQDLEQDAGRVRRERWGPRTLDVDVLLYGDLTLNDPDLIIPHPRMFERAFVLYPPVSYTHLTLPTICSV